MSLFSSIIARFIFHCERVYVMMMVSNKVTKPIIVDKSICSNIDIKPIDITIMMKIAAISFL